MVSGFPGDHVTVEAQLRAANSIVAGVQSDITFDSLNAPIAPLADGAPDCTVNPLLKKQEIFVFRPINCMGTACTMVRAAVFSNFPITPITDGSLLYTCQIGISASALPGRYPLTLANITLSDGNGMVVPGAGGLDGAVVVEARPTATPTPSSTVTLTVLPSVTPTPTMRPCGGDCNGDGEVTVDELVTMVRIALGSQQLPACTAGDINGDGDITVEEIIAAVNNALGTCPH